MTVPRGGRLYWICQAAGWGSFTAYVLIAYVANVAVIHPWDVVSIVLFNAGICPALTHGLRHWMHTHGWLQLPGRRLWWRCAAFALTAAAMLTGAVVFGALAAGAQSFPWPALAGIFAGFTWALSGWLTIYYVVHVRRRRDALQLELAVTTREAQLRALRAQVNPHFLFNCLNSLRHLIGTNPDRAQAVVTNLADILRYALDSDRRDLTPLNEELEAVDRYLELERVRFEERLRVERAIDPSALGVRVPPMLLQTLVDNAIKHGISELTEGGVVRLEARTDAGRLTLKVQNTGALKTGAPTTGYGLRNARERLRLIYGNDASLTLQDVNGRTEAMLQIPVDAAAGSS